MRGRLFRSLGSDDLAAFISQAKRLVCFAAPGIQIQPAEAIAEVAKKIGPNRVAVTLDFDERVMRMGFGNLDAVKILRKAGILVDSLSGLRSGIVIVDDDGYVFTPTALYLEKEPRVDDIAPNALHLSKEQVSEVLARMSPASNELDAVSSEADPPPANIEDFDTKPTEVSEQDIATVENRLVNAPPVPFDVARQVRVYNAYLQYVEAKLTGFAIQRRRITIPKILHNLGDSEELNQRLKTTFDVMERGSKLSSKYLEDKLNEIRNNFTRSLGKPYGRVVLKSSKYIFDKRIEEFREEICEYKIKLKKDLGDEIKKSRTQIIDYYLPRIKESPPDHLLGQTMQRPIGDDIIREWIGRMLDTVLPDSESLIDKMNLEVTFRDLTFDTLNDEKFLKAIRKGYPREDWDKVHDEFRAARQDEC